MSRGLITMSTNVVYSAAYPLLSADKMVRTILVHTDEYSGYMAITLTLALLHYKVQSMDKSIFPKCLYTLSAKQYS